VTHESGRGDRSAPQSVRRLRPVIIVLGLIVELSKTPFRRQTSDDRSSAGRILLSYSSLLSDGSCPIMQPQSRTSSENRPTHPGDSLASRPAFGLDPQGIVDGHAQLLLTTEVAFRGLDRHVS
jgi:hypothetical protein